MSNVNAILIVFGNVAVDFRVIVSTGLYAVGAWEHGVNNALLLSAWPSDVRGWLHRLGHFVIDKIALVASRGRSVCLTTQAIVHGRCRSTTMGEVGSVAKAHKLQSDILIRDDTCIGGLRSWQDGTASNRRARLESGNRTTAEGRVVVWSLDIAIVSRVALRGWKRLLVGDVALVGPREGRGNNVTTSRPSLR